jgi:uridine phosphorylase
MGVQVMTDGWDRSRSVTQARQFIDYMLEKQGIVLAAMPDLCVISYNDGLIDRAKSVSAYQTIRLGLTTRTELLILEPNEMPAIGLIRGQHGASMSAVMLEELIALGFSHFLTVGAAGHPQFALPPRARIGELILPTAALVYEGTSRHYGQAATLISVGRAGTDLLKTVMQSLGIFYQEGLAATTDGFYRETPAFLEDMEHQGVMAVDMELSALLTVGAYHGKGVASILYVSDIIEGRSGRWLMGLTDKYLEALTENLLSIVSTYARALQPTGS